MGLFTPSSPLSVTILNNDKTMFQGDIKSLTSENKDGKFDILNSHSNFITIILNSLTVRSKNGQSEQFDFDRGVMQCYNNKIKIFLGV